MAVYDWVIRWIFSITSEILGGVAVILPSAVREHFFSSRERIVAFIFLMLIVNGAVKLVAGALRSIMDLFGAGGHLSVDVMDFFHLTNPFNRGYNDGYDDGRWYKGSKLPLLGKRSVWVRAWNVMKYGLVFLVLYSVINTSDW